jgi:hypothetical protein
VSCEPRKGWILEARRNRNLVPKFRRALKIRARIGARLELRFSARLLNFEIRPWIGSPTRVALMILSL